MTKLRASFAVRTSLLYVLIAALWIWVSDSVVANITLSSPIQVLLQNFKGMMFVLVTGGVLYTLLVRETRRLKANQKFFETILDTSPAAIFVSDRMGRYLHVNREAEKLLGISREKILGHGREQIFPPEIARRLQEQDDQVLNTRQPTQQEEVLTVNGKKQFYLTLKFPLLDEQQQVYAICGIITDVTELTHARSVLGRMDEEVENRVKRRTEELAALNRQLAELDQMRARFIANVSHDLRNPVTSLDMRLYMMERNGYNPQHLPVLREQVNQLKELITAVLDLSRLELSRSKLSFMPVDLNVVVQKEISALMDHLHGDKVRLLYTLDKNLLPVLGEPVQLARVVSNLVANAIRYTPQGEVVVYTETRNNKACLCVTDTGLGIAEEDIPHLFERFYRGSTALQAEIPGTGLGLSIVREIVDLHNGTIEVESHLGQGTTFWVYLPLATKN